jgi:hypothetical protein
MQKKLVRILLIYLRTLLLCGIAGACVTAANARSSDILLDSPPSKQPATLTHNKASTPILPELAGEDDTAAAQAGQQNTEYDALARNAAAAGNMLNAENKRQAISGYAQSLLTNQVDQTLQNHLKRYGNAKINLNFDNNFSLRDSAVDFIAPVYDRLDNTVLLQNSAHYSESAWQLNSGIAWRHFNKLWMGGANLFADYIPRDGHTRVGVGLEYWRDFVKLSMNGYAGFSGWKHSRKMEDYQAKVANGWDIRAEGYLPFYPALGLKLEYEKFYGNNVDIFGNSEFQHNPHSVTTGLFWNPVPLITLGVDEKMSAGSRSETNFWLNFNYLFGDKLSDLIDPGLVAERHSLAGSRYDFVNRNNNIILKYKKDNLLQLQLPAELHGQTGARIPLNAVVKSKYPLQAIKWSYNDLAAAGGYIEGNANQYYVILPDHISASQQWKISGQAWDNRGNASDTVSTQLIVTDSSRHMALTLDKSSVAAGSEEKAKLTVSVNDASGNPVTDIQDQLKVELEAAKSGSEPAISKFSASGPGVYQATVSAGQGVGCWNITVNGVNALSESVRFCQTSTTQPIVPGPLEGRLTLGEKLKVSWEWSAGPTPDKYDIKWVGLSDKRSVKLNPESNTAEYLITEKDIGKTLEKVIITGRDSAGNTLGESTVVADSSNSWQSQSGNTIGIDHVSVSIAEDTSHLSSEKENRLSWVVKSNGKIVNADNISLQVAVKSIVDRLGNQQKLPDQQPVNWDDKSHTLTIHDESWYGMKYSFTTSLSIAGQPVNLEKDVDDVITWNSTSPNKPTAYFYGDAKGAPEIINSGSVQSNSIYIAGEHYKISYTTAYIIDKYYPGQTIDANWQITSEAHGASSIGSDMFKWLQNAARSETRAGHPLTSDVLDATIWLSDNGRSAETTHLTRKVNIGRVDKRGQPTTQQKDIEMGGNFGPWLVPAQGL